ncbi:MAG: flagellar FlbD family protein [Oscillospiraceae bacterium]|nr:flagellar FlbD family protein [Oscillospiraceae bacterium]
MITLTKLNEVEFVLNCDLIETIQENPDTTIYLTNGRIYIVKETIEEIVRKTVQYKQRIFNNINRGDFGG